MPCTLPQFALVTALVIGAVCVQPIHAQGSHRVQPDDVIEAEWYEIPEVQAAPIDGYLTEKATTHNGLQVAKALEPALERLLESGKLSSVQIKQLEIFADALEKQPGGIGASLEQLAGSQNANLAAATDATTQHLNTQLLSTLRALPDDDQGHFWVQGLGNDGSLDQQGGSASLKYATQGLLMGADWAVDSAWRLGVTGAKSTSQFSTRDFAGDLDSWHLGGYAVRRDGPMALRLGALYSSHAGQNKRSVTLLDYKEHLRGSYNAQSQSVFSELGYQLGSSALSVEPFTGLGYQRYQRDGYKESGGVTALNVGSQTQQNLSSTFGLRLASVYQFDSQMSLTPHLSTSWKHLYGNVDSRVSQSFRYKPALMDDFTLNGTSLDRNSLALQAGLDLAWSAQHTLGLTYSAQSGNQSSNQGLMAQWRMRF